MPWFPDTKFQRSALAATLCTFMILPHPLVDEMSKSQCYQPTTTCPDFK